MSGKRFYLIRHGISTTQQRGVSICLGSRSDPPLAEEGRRQAEMVLAAELPDVSVVYSSPLRRCLETAEILAGDRQQVRQVSLLTEMDMGHWEGMDFERIRREYPVEYELRGRHPAAPPPGGETFEAAADRMERALRQMIEENPLEEEFVIVTHGGIISAFLCKVAGEDFDKNRNYRLPHCGIGMVAYEKGGFRQI